MQINKEKREEEPNNNPESNPIPHQHRGGWHQQHSIDLQLLLQMDDMEIDDTTTTTTTRFKSFSSSSS